jgi:hypothetical protein
MDTNAPNAEPTAPGTDAGAGAAEGSAPAADAERPTHVDPPAADPPRQDSGTDSFFWVAPPQPAPDSDEARAVASAWQDQALWSAVGSSIGDSIFRWRIFAAVAGILGLGLSVAAGIGWFGTDRAATIWATAGVLLLAAVPYLRQQLVSDQRVQQWTLARIASEDLKQSIYRHLMGVLQPVAGGGATSDQSAANLVRRGRSIKKSVADLAGVAAAIVPPENKDRPPPLSLTVEGYVTRRVQGQMKYYRTKGETNGRITQRLRQAELVLGLVTVLMGAWASGLGSAPSAEALKAVMPAASTEAVNAAASAAAAGAGLVSAPGTAPASAAPAASGAQAASPAPAASGSAPAPAADPPQAKADPATPQSGWLALLALVAAATGAITTYLAASRHAELASKYYATYDRLKDLLAEWRVAPDRDQPERVARFVDTIEKAISDEYGGWVTDWAATRQAPK